MAIGTGNHPKALWPGVNAWFGQKYNEHEPEWPAIFDVQTSNKAFEEDVESYGFGLAPIKPQGEPTQYDTHAQGGIARYTHVAYSLGYIVTKEELDDNLYSEVSMKRASALAFSMNQTRENVGANILNRAFNSSYTGHDGLELLSTAHTLAGGGTYSNELTIAADLSEASLEDLCIQIGSAVNARGHKIKLKPECLIIPIDLHFDASRILKSIGQNDTANNAINALRVEGAIPKVAINHYLTDSDAFFIKTNAPEGLKWFNRVDTEFGKDEDFDTDNAKAKGYMRFSAGWTDPRGCYGTPGA